MASIVARARVLMVLAGAVALAACLPSSATVQVTDSCTGLLVELWRQPVP